MSALPKRHPFAVFETSDSVRTSSPFSLRLIAGQGDSKPAPTAVAAENFQQARPETEPRLEDDFAARAECDLALQLLGSIDAIREAIAAPLTGNAEAVIVHAAEGLGAVVDAAPEGATRNMLARALESLRVDWRSAFAKGHFAASADWRIAARIVGVDNADDLGKLSGFEQIQLCRGMITWTVLALGAHCDYLQRWSIAEAVYSADRGIATIVANPDLSDEQRYGLLGELLQARETLARKACQSDGAQTNTDSPSRSSAIDDAGLNRNIDRLIDFLALWAPQKMVLKRLVRSQHCDDGDDPRGATGDLAWIAGVFHALPAPLLGMALLNVTERLGDPRQKYDDNLFLLTDLLDGQHRRSRQRASA